MQCSDLERDLESLVDGELLPSDRLMHERHMSQCPGCNRLVQARRELRRVLREAVSTPSPSSLRRKVSERLDDEDQKSQAAQGSWLSRFWQQPSVMLAAGALAGLLVMPGLRTARLDRSDRPPVVVDAMISRHQLPLPLDVTGEPEKVRSWFAGKVPFMVPAPQLEPVAVLQGGRLSNLGDREAVLLRYQQSGQPISVFVFDPQGLDLKARRTVIGNREVFLSDARGYQVAVFRDRGLGYAVTSTLDEPEFLKVVSAMVSGR
jgi:anti-sigma factor RsiW